MADDNPPDRDKSLLERLNALKKSSVSFEISPNPLQNREDISDLTARFHKITAGRKSIDPEALTRAIAESASIEDDAAPPSPTVEELLADLGPEEQWKIDRDETSQINDLLKEARKALPPSNGEAERETNQGTSGDRPKDPDHRETDHGTKELKHASTTSSAKTDDDEEEEAALQLQRILDELSVDDEPPS
ncbi:MAG: hypothetical protein Q9201_005341, partial [Fulgogasparrea decipioides]